MFSHKTEEICPIFGAPVNFFLLYFVTQISQMTQIFPSSISYSADETCSVRLRRFFLQLYFVTQIFLLFFFLSHRFHSKFAQIFPTPFPITPWDFSQMERNGRGKGWKIWKRFSYCVSLHPELRRLDGSFRLRVDRKLLSKTLFTLHKYIVNS